MTVPPKKIIPSLALDKGFCAYDSLVLIPHSFFNTLFSKFRCFTDMFTPPPSPLPPVRQVSLSECDTHVLDGVQTGRQPIEDIRISPSRRRFHRSIRWTIIFVPLALVLLATYTRFWVHPAVFDLLSTDCGHELTIRTKMVDWSLHEPHKVASNRLVQRSTSNRLVARNTTKPTPAPTVPANPVLPTPFPQPFDTTLSTNFSTTSCYDFFLNMTQVDAFRSCRPFALLITTSHAFVMVISRFLFVS